MVDISHKLRFAREETMGKTFENVKDTDALVVASGRLPIASVKPGKNGAPNTSAILPHISAEDMAGQVLQHIVPESGLDPEDVERLYLGSVISQRFSPYAFATLAWQNAFEERGNQVIAQSVRKECGSSLYAIGCLVDDIRSGKIHAGVGAGSEKMCGCENALIEEGLTNERPRALMAKLADMHTETLGDKFGRAAHDEYARESYRLAALHANDHTVIPICDPRDGSIVLDHDDAKVYEGAKLDKFLSTALVSIEGCSAVTMANGSKYGSGAGGVVIVSGKMAKDHGLAPIVRLHPLAEWSEDSPEKFIVAPAGAVRLALQNAGLKPSDIGWWINNPAFSLAPMWLMDQFGIPREKMNPWSDAIWHGHAIGATGAILTVEAIELLQKTGERFALVSICNAIGEAVAMIVENLSGE